MSAKVVIISLIALALYKKYKVLKLYFRSLVTTFGRFKISAFLKAEKTGKDVFRETANGCIKVFRRVVEVGTCYVDAVFRAFQLGLQFQKVLVGFQVGIIFGNGKQLAESGSDRTLSFLIFSQLFLASTVIWVALLRASTTLSSVSFS